MKLNLLPLLLFPVVAQGQDAGTDSVSVSELAELTVVADAQRTDAVKTVYLPTANQKAAASGGVALLWQMNIPQLSVNPVSETVKTADNQNVSFFINYVAANREDIAGLNTADVKRVEYLEFPVDARFMRAQHVVNFITRSYRSGGYTKINGKQRFMVGSGEASLYSKFVYRKMEYDLMVTGDYDRNSRTGTVSDETYTLKSGTVRRQSGTEAARYRRYGLYSALRATWNRSDAFSFRNLFSYRRIKTPVNSSSGYVHFSDLYPSEEYSLLSPSANNAIGWDGELYAALGRGWTLNGNVNAEVLYNRTTRAYSAFTVAIQNHAAEDAWALRGSVRANKSLSDKISLFTSLDFGCGRNKIRYFGTADALNKFRQSFAGIYVGAAMNFAKLAGSVDAGYASEANAINGSEMTEFYPFTHVDLKFAPDNKHSFNLWLQYATFSPDAAMKNPNILRQHELLYISGNPDLDYSRNIVAHLSYTYLPGNKWQMTAYANFFCVLNRQIPVYRPDGPNGMMLKKYQNDGNYNHGQIGASLTGKFFAGRLAVSFSPRLLLYSTTGSYNTSHYPLAARMNVDYYAGKFFFNAFWESGISYVDGETACLSKIPGTYSLSAGWAARGWNIQLSVVNPFQSSWQAGTETLSTQWYNCTIARFGTLYHRRIALCLTYTINYGRSVKQTGELSGEKHISTSILR